MPTPTSKNTMSLRTRPLRRQATGMPRAAPKPLLAGRPLQRERSMRVPAIENDMLNRLGVARADKAALLAARSPRKGLLAQRARKAEADALPAAGDSPDTPEGRRLFAIPGVPAKAGPYPSPEDDVELYGDPAEARAAAAAALKDALIRCIDAHRDGGVLEFIRGLPHDDVCALVTSSIRACYRAAREDADEPDSPDDAGGGDISPTLERIAVFPDAGYDRARRERARLAPGTQGAAPAARNKGKGKASADPLPALELPLGASERAPLFAPQQPGEPSTSRKRARSADPGPSAPSKRFKHDEPGLEPEPAPPRPLRREGAFNLSLGLPAVAHTEHDAAHLARHAVQKDLLRSLLDELHAHDAAPASAAGSIVLNGAPHAARDALVRRWAARRDAKVPPGDSTADRVRALEELVLRARAKAHRRRVRRALRLGLPEPAAPALDAVNIWREMWDEEAEYEASWDVPGVDAGAEEAEAEEEFAPEDVSEPDSDPEWDAREWCRPDFRKDYAPRFDVVEYPVEPQYWTVY
ncbi:hypothetical protein BC834DRAFT_1003887 [Gloeopeniophorella convolvens]|nr:hypothetical protein BC834DRAFT_1003887 [Gloeopeniophorella convolvens]